MLIDARLLEADALLECDLCIVGAGIAGIAIARRLRTSGLSIVLLEGGGADYELSAQALYRGERAGQRYFRLDGCRWRLFGGSSNRWGGWCRPLDAVDFTARAWLALSGWPITAQTLEPYAADAAELLELPHGRFELEAWRQRLPAPLALEGTHFENALILHSPETNFAERHGPEVLAASNIRTILHANLTTIRLATPAACVGELRAATLGGRQVVVRPRAVVLAAGGIENARLLLAARAERAAGIGNEHDWVGRCFMEHLHVPLGHMLLRAGAGNNRFYRRLRLPEIQLRGIIKPTATAQEASERLATSIALEEASFSQGTPFLGWPPAVMYAPVRCYRALRRTGLVAMAEALKNVAQRVNSIPNRVRTLQRACRARHGVAPEPESSFKSVYSLYLRAEQAPDPANRVTLAAELDPLGLPRARLEWQIRAIDAESVKHWLEVLDRDLDARGLGRVALPSEEWLDGVVGGPHHMGTTRMSSDPRRGVVDADCRVHSVENLYIAGSSVFTTSGHANPTFSMLALALRLADTLRRRLSR